MSSTVVVGYDQTPHSDTALDEAVREARMRGAALNVVTAFRRVAPVGPSLLTAPAPDTEDAAHKSAEAVARHGVDRVLDRDPRLVVTPYALVGSAGKIIAQAAHGADLLVMGTRGRGGFDGLQVGSTSMRALADACCPVLIVRGQTDAGRDRVVAAVDIDEPCEAILDFAFAEASRRKARITVVHVWDEPWILAYGQEDPGIAEDIALIEREREDRLSALIQSVRRRYPDLNPFHQVATGSAGRLLVEASHHADLLVTGARRHAGGRHGMQIGPVTQAVLQHSGCPVAVVPVSAR